MKKSIIVLGLMVLTLILSGCTGSDYDYITDDYQKHSDTLEEDMGALEKVSDKLVTASNMAESDGEYTEDEILQLKTIATEYVDVLNTMGSHLTSFNQFIDKYELELKDLGYDTYQDKKDIDEMRAMMLSAEEDMAVFLE